VPELLVADITPTETPREVRERIIRSKRASMRRSRCPLPVLLLCLGSLLASVAQAQGQSTSPAADPWSGVEEMIVTGTGGVATLVQAPTSVVAFDDTEIGKLGAENISDLAEFTPNLEINSPYAASNPQLFIRGVGLQDSNSNASSAVMVTLDGVLKNSPAGQLSSLFDVESVEVLRGPQGAKFGRNASAGVVRIKTRAPQHEYGAGTNVSYGRFNQVDVDGFLNIPLVEDVFATRMAFRYVRRDPLGQNRCFDDRDNQEGTLSNLVGTKCYWGMVYEPGRFNNSPVAYPPKETNDRENWFARWSFLLEPTETMKFRLTMNGGQNLGLAPQFQNRGTETQRGRGNVPVPDLGKSAKNYVDLDACYLFEPNGACRANDRFPGAGDPFNGDYSRGGKERLTVGGVTLNSDWSDGPWSVTSVTNLDYTDREVVVDFDASPFVQADAYITDESWQFFEDAQLTWNDERGVVLSAGLQYFHERLQADNNFWNTPSSNLRQKILQTTDAAAAFGYVEWELTETLIFEGGARVNYERKNFQISSFYNPYNGNVFLPPLVGYNDRRELAEQVRPSGEFIMRFEPTDDVKFYGRFTRGYKGQHFNGNVLSTAQEIRPVNAEFVNSFEVGWATNWLDGLLSWSGAAFYYDYENQQVYQLQSAEGVNIPVPVLVNAEDSRLIGMESELTIAWEGIRWYNSVGVIYSEYSDFRRVIEEITVSQTGGVSISFDIENYSGNSLVNAPEFSLVGFLQYDWEMPSALGTLTPRFDYRFKSRVFYTPENDSRIGAGPRWIFDARVDWKTFDGNITLAVWCRNLLDEYYAVTAYDRKKGTGAIVYVVSEPRTYGLTATFRF
jgi:iron complex outermembrane receptor protein